MAVLALVLLVAWLFLVVAVRGYLHHRRTGEIATPRRVEPGTPSWWARLISTLGIGFAFAAPIAELIGLSPVGVLDHAALRYAGAVIAMAGIGGTFAAQVAMGDSWRPDVDPEARTPLVTTGPFRLVRNPVLTSTAVTWLGLALMVPNVFAALMVVTLTIAVQIQVRLVEEPHLERIHGMEYARYAARTGRFVPWIGRWRGRRGDLEG